MSASPADRAPELSQGEMQILHDLLAIFSTHADGHSDSELWHEYADWWHANQSAASDFAMKLDALSESGSRVLDRDQIRNLAWLLGPATTLLRGGSFTRDEIAECLGHGSGVMRWSVCDMQVLGFGELRCRALFDECYQVLGEALGE